MRDILVAEPEIVEMIRQYHLASKRKKPKAGTPVTIITIIGRDQR
jgi:hypothetical protein